MGETNIITLSEHSSKLYPIIIFIIIDHYIT